MRKFEQDYGAGLCKCGEQTQRRQARSHSGGGREIKTKSNVLRHEEKHETTERVHSRAGMDISSSAMDAKQLSTSAIAAGPEQEHLADAMDVFG